MREAAGSDFYLREYFDLFYFFKWKIIRFKINFKGVEGKDILIVGIF